MTRPRLIWRQLGWNVGAPSLVRLDDMNLSLDQLDAQMCWECWPSDDTPFEEVESESA